MIPFQLLIKKIIRFNALKLTSFYINNNIYIIELKLDGYNIDISLMFFVIFLGHLENNYLNPTGHLFLFLLFWFNKQQLNYKRKSK